MFDTYSHIHELFQTLEENLWEGEQYDEEALRGIYDAIRFAHLMDFEEGADWATERLTQLDGINLCLRNCLTRNPSDSAPNILDFMITEYTRDYYIPSPKPFPKLDDEPATEYDTIH